VVATHTARENPRFVMKRTATHFPRIAAMHGDRDDVVPIAPSRQLTAHLRALGYEVTLREFSGVRHPITPDMVALQVELLDSAARSESREGAKDREP
jgi:predicted esterase